MVKLKVSPVEIVAPEDAALIVIFPLTSTKPPISGPEPFVRTIPLAAVEPYQPLEKNAICELVMLPVAGTVMFAPVRLTVMIPLTMPFKRRTLKLVSDQPVDAVRGTPAEDVVIQPESFA
jgi:hypothetical protein